MTAITVPLLALLGNTLFVQASGTSDPTVVFVCEHGAAKSVIATAYFNKIAATSKGLRSSSPSAARCHPTRSRPARPTTGTTYRVIRGTARCEMRSGSTSIA